MKRLSRRLLRKLGSRIPHRFLYVWRVSAYACFGIHALACGYKVYKGVPWNVVAMCVVHVGFIVFYMICRDMLMCSLSGEYKPRLRGEFFMESFLVMIVSIVFMSVILRT